MRNAPVTDRILEAGSVILGTTTMPDWGMLSSGVSSLHGITRSTADGDRLRIDEDHHLDLFWAVRGGGGNVGVVTRFRLRLHEVDHVLGGTLVVPATPEVLEAFVAEAQAAPEELSTIADVMPCPPMPFVPAEAHGALVIMALLVHAGPAEQGEAVLARIRGLAAPVADLVRPIRYPEMYPPDEAGGGGDRPTAVARTMFLDHVDRSTAAEIMDRLAGSDAAMRVAQLRVLGGAMGRVPAGATAFAHPVSPIMVNLAAFYDGHEDRARREAWVTDFAAARDQGDDGAYVNFLGREGPARVRAAYPGGT